MDHHHGGMEMPGSQGPSCKMNMLFNWDVQDVCIVFHWWRIDGVFSLLVSLAIVALLSVGYELVRELSRRYESKSQEYLNSLPRKDVDAREQGIKFTKAAFYALQVFYSFFIMLIFMTYNGWIMIAVAFGAFLGYLGFGNATSTKSVACH